MVDDRFLLAPEGVIAEDAVEHGQRLALRRPPRALTRRRRRPAVVRPWGGRMPSAVSSSIAMSATMSAMPCSP
jgi:hypothetical protein